MHSFPKRGYVQLKVESKLLIDVNFQSSLPLARKFPLEDQVNTFDAWIHPIHARFIERGKGKTMIQLLVGRIDKLVFHLYEPLWANMKEFLPHSAKCGWKLLERDKRLSMFIRRSGVCLAGALLSSVVQRSLLNLTFSIHVH